jgi:hypothetical protein
MTPGTLVRHRAWGLGKVIESPLPYLIIHFPSLASDPAGPRRKLQAQAPQLSVSEVQSDPELDQVPLVSHTAKSGKPRTPRPKTPPKPLQHGFEQALAWFRSTVPGGFRDEKFVTAELKDKRLAQQEWTFYFGNGKAQALLDANDTAAITEGLTKLFQATKLPAPFEVMAAREGLKDGDCRRQARAPACSPGPTSRCCPSLPIPRGSSSSSRRWPSGWRAG